MIRRRTVLAGLAAGAASPVLALPAYAQSPSYAAKYPELVFAVAPGENASGVTDRYAPYMVYLSKQMGVKTTLRIVNDYAAVIEGQRSGNIHIAYYGPAAFARALLTGVKTEAFEIEVNADSSKGYYSVFYVRADSPYKTVADLKGKNLGLVDPNSNSGFSMPMYALDKQGVTADKFFDKVVITGSHENALIALAQGTVDVAANWWNSDDDSNLTRMLNKNMLKSADGKLLTKADFRIILKSDLIINPPTAYLADLPPDLKTAIRRAFFDAPKLDKAAFDKLSDGKDLPPEPIDNAAYDETIKLIKFVDALRKKSG